MGKALDDLKEAHEQLIVSHKKKRKLAVFGLVLALASIALTLVWYDWKLCLILFLFVWGNNIGQK